MEDLKIITTTDLKHGLLTLSPKKFEDLCKYKGHRIWIKDNLGCESFLLGNDSSEDTLRFCGLKKWYSGRNIEVDTKLNIVFNENELLEGQAVLQIQYVEETTDAVELEVYTRTIEHCLENESKLEEVIKSNPDCIEKGLKLHSQQYNTPAGKLDLLFVDRNNNYVVVELKNTKTSDEVVGQISRYMGYIAEEKVKDKNAKVRGIILAPEGDGDAKLEYAVSANDNLELRYFKFNIEFTKPSKIKE
ncbi:MAG: PDDEXK nuclease domain-containing protein [Bacteroidales bacterium]|jgi:hypothetical protein|nr:PDDEXK nuclease domain-containing protein [Bacteroidales bacterium]